MTVAFTSKKRNAQCTAVVELAGITMKRRKALLYEEELVRKERQSLQSE